MSNSVRVSIFFSDTGGGHRSAAEAVKAGIEAGAKSAKPSPLKVSVSAQPMIEKSHPWIGHMVAFYNHLARHHTTWIKYLYSIIHLLKPESDLLWRLYQSYMHDILQQQQPSLLIAVHPLLVEPLARGRDEFLDPSVKVGVVITDPNEALWRAWACNKADLFVAPNNVVADKLKEWGIDSNKIHVLGMPVNPSFLLPSQTTRDNFLTSIGLKTDVYTVCINAGWAGNAHLLQAYKELSHSKRDMQVVLLCGYNKQLEKAAKKAAAESKIPTVVLPFCNQMSDLMRSVDVMVTKAGGLTTFESLATRLPIVFDNTIEPMPQEEPTMRMLIESGLAKRMDKPGDLPQIIDAMPARQSENSQLPSTYQFDLTDDGTFRIGDTLLASVTDSSVRSVEDVA